MFWNLSLKIDGNIAPPGINYKAHIKGREI